MPKKKQAADRYRVFSTDVDVHIEESAPNKSKAIELANSLAEQNVGVNFTVWNPNNEHIYQVWLKDDSWSVYAPHEDVLPEELEGQEHLMMSRITRPLGRDASVPRIVVKGAVYKQADEYALEQQYKQIMLDEAIDNPAWPWEHMQPNRLVDLVAEVVSRPELMTNTDHPVYDWAEEVLRDAGAPEDIVTGATRKTAQLQELLQQYESASGQVIKILTEAHKAALGKDFGKANMVLKKLDGVLDEKALKELMELNDTMAGVVGIEGSN